MFGKSTFGGGFGQQQQPANTGFGQQTTQQTGFGGFGATNNTTSAFGQPAQQTSAFGAPATGGFGTNTTTSAFGQAKPTGFGATAAPSAFGSNQASTTTTGFGATNTGAFGAGNTTSAFGQQASGGLFGQQRPQTTGFGSSFGQQQQQQTGFGATSGNAFGNQQNGTAQADFAPTQDRDITTGVNHFFQTITAMPQYKNFSLEELRLQDYSQGRKNAGAAGTTTTTGAFGSSGFNQPSTTGFGSTGGNAFGSGNTSAFGGGNAFGQTNQPATTSAFGQPNTTTSTFGTGFGQPATSAFGQPAAAATTNAFGQPAATTNAFGQPAATTTNAFGSTNAFGQPAGAATSAFGAKPATTTTGGFGTFGQPATSAFGQPAATTNAFGQPATTTTNAFGQPAGATNAFGAKPATTTTGGFGTFGQPGAAATGGFGQTANKPTGLTFGNTTQTTGGFGTGFGQQQPATTTGFGQPAAATGTTSLFGAKPATGGGLFGATGGGFGSFGQTANTQTTGFGAKPTLGNTTGFGTLNTTGQQNTLSGGFGTLNTGLGQQQGSFNLPTQGGLTSFGTNNLPNGMIATIDNNTYGNNPLFDLNINKNNVNTNNKPEATAVAVSERVKKPSTHFPASPRVVSRIKLRGFTFPTSHTTNVTTPITKHVDTEQDATLGAQAFRKPLMFDQNETQNVAQTLAHISRKKVTFNPELEHGAYTSSPSPLFHSPVVESNPATVTAAESQGYSMSPSYEQLASMSKDELKSVRFTVSRRGYGRITYNQPVDLSMVPLTQIMGDLIVIENKSIVVYPDQSIKPPVHQQLNAPATITLENCFTTDKQTGAALTDKQHPRVVAFVKKLQERPNVEFVSYDANTSEWTFKVTSF